MVRERNGIRKNGEGNGKYSEYNLDLMHLVHPKNLTIYRTSRVHTSIFAIHHCAVSAEVAVT